MILQYECMLDRYGNMIVAGGWVYKQSTQHLRETGADPGISLSGLSMDSGTFNLRGTGPSSAAFVGGSGRLMIATPSVALSNPDAETEILGFYGWEWDTELRPINNRGVRLTIASATSAEIVDPSGPNVIAEWVSGADAPLGTYAATTYGKDTYNGGDAFNLTLTHEIASPRLPAAADLDPGETTVYGGQYSPTSNTRWLADDPDWEILIDTYGGAELSDGTDVVAIRDHSDTWDDPSGFYDSTSYGATTYNGGDAFQIRVNQRNAFPRSGYAIVRCNMDGADLVSVSKPYLSATIPTDTATAIHIPVFYSNGSTIAQQLHTGMILL